MSTINGCFCGQNINQTYKSILNISTCANDTLPGSGRCIVRDSSGIASALEVGQSGEGVKVTGAAIITCNIQGASGQVTSNWAAGTVSTGGLTVTNADVTVATNKFKVTSTETSTSNSFTTNGDLTADGSATIGAAANGGATICGNVAVGGCITATADIIAFSASDKRFKDDLNKICNTKDILNGLTGYSFKWNEASGREGTDLGVIAQDVKEVLPQIVQEREDGYLAVDYPKLIPVLIEEVKRLSDEVEKLKSIQTF